MDDKMAIRTDRSHIFYWVNNIFFTNRANQSLIFYGVKIEIIATQIKMDILNSHKFWGVIESMQGHTLKFGEISKHDYSAGERFKKG
ncbi:hypothetical protein Q5M59_13470 [Acinetobacter baumannii]|nr:hypothetical protein [Acinetobacter baumannii]